tara:strand:- start:2743 stop:6174 length:3432 start_codon:yes stop_codon:yes gene_type:complete
MSGFKIGQTVETAQQQQGLVKYVGPIHVADGNWLGIELPTATGKNDGSVRGERYFTCPVGHGLFVKDTNIVRVVSQPVTKPPPKPAPLVPSASSSKAPSSSKPAPATARPRPSSVIAAKPTSRLSTVSKRQSVAPAPLRAPVRKASIAAGSATSATPAVRPGPVSSAASSTKPVRDSTVDALQTKLRHLEKQHTEDQDLLKELSHARDERDRFHGIIQKLQGKCQTQHQECLDLKAQLHTLQSDNDRLSKAHEEHEVDLEDALVDKEMAEERADVAEIELEHLRSKLEERDMEVDILRSEAELFTADMSEAERQEAGYYQLQHENERLRQALITLKEMTGEQELDLKARVRDLEAETEQLEPLRSANTALQTQVGEVSALIEHLQAQVDANAEWEDISAELTAKNQELEDRITTQDAVIRDLESLKELNDELEAQRIDEAEDLLSELAAKDSELTEQARVIEDQEGQIAEQLELISKFRELVLELQGRMADAESSRNMTEAQVKDTTGRFNEVMDLNRRLHASKVEATTKQFKSEMNSLCLELGDEQMSIMKETGSVDFIVSKPIQVYLLSKRAAAKTSMVSSFLTSMDKQLSYNGGLDEAKSRLGCIEAIMHLSFIRSASNRVWSAIAVSPLTEVAKFGHYHDDFLKIDDVLDESVDKLKLDEVNFQDLAGSLKQCAYKQKTMLSMRKDVLAPLPENEILGRVQTIAAYLVYLEANFSVISTMLAFLAAHGQDLPSDSDGEASSGDEVAKVAEKVLKHLTPSAALCTSAKLASQKLLRTTEALREDSLYPHILGGQPALVEVERYLELLHEEAAQWGGQALDIFSSSFAANGTFSGMDRDINSLLDFYKGSRLERFGSITRQLNGWNEEASLLINSSEIEHGPSLWKQKAKDVEAERRRSSEISAFLEKLKADHKAAILHLHEREQELENKHLENEHLKAWLQASLRHREALEQHMEEIDEETRRIDAVLKESRKPYTRPQAIEEEVPLPNETEHERVSIDASTKAKEAVEQPLVLRGIPAGLNSLLDAFQCENHWLRRREHADVFDRNIRDIAAKMWAAQRWEEIMGRSELSESEDLSTPPRAYSPPLNNTQPKELPLALTCAQTGWYARGDNWLYLIEEEEEEEEEEGTVALEAFSELQM